MGEAWIPEDERVLCILPFPEPTELLAQIKTRHPNVEFIYKSIRWAPGAQLDQEVLDSCTFVPLMFYV